MNFKYKQMAITTLAILEKLYTHAFEMVKFNSKIKFGIQNVLSGARKLKDIQLKLSGLDLFSSLLIF